jgi:WG containing repeat
MIFKNIAISCSLVFSFAIYAQVPPGYSKDRQPQAGGGGYGPGSGSGPGHSYSAETSPESYPDGDISIERPYKEGEKTEFTIFSENKKWGVKKTEGSNIVLNAVYDRVNACGDRFILYKDKKIGLYNAQTQKDITPMVYDSVQFKYGACDGIFRLKKKEAWGALDLNGKELLPFAFFKIEYISANGIALAKKKKEDAIALYFNAKPYKKELKYGHIYDNVIIATHNGKKGMVAGNKEVLAFIYDSIYTSRPFYGWNKKAKENFRTYFDDAKNVVVIKDGKYGLANSDGTFIFLPQYDKITYEGAYKFYKIKAGKQVGLYFKATGKKTDVVYDNVQQDGRELVIVTKDKKQGVINYSGAVIVPVEYDKVEVTERDKIKVVKGGKTGLVDKNGTFTIPLEYDSLDTFVFNFAGLYRVEKDKKNGVITTDNKIIVPLLYEYVSDLDKYIYVAENKKKGLYTPDGDVVAPVVYDDIKRSETEHSKLLILQKEGKYSFVTKDRKLLYSDQFTAIDYLYDEERLINPFNMGNAFRVVKRDKDKYGIFEEFSATLVIPAVYDGIYQKLDNGKETFLVAKKGNKRGVINGNGKEVLPFVYDSINFNRPVGANFMEAKPTAIAVKNKKFGVVNFNGTVLVPFEYDDLVMVSGNGLYKAKKKGLYSLVNENNKVLNAGPFEEITQYEGDDAYVFYKGLMHAIDGNGNVSGTAVAMQPHKGFATFEAMKMALVKALDSHDNALLKDWVSKAAPSAYILIYFKNSSLDERTGVQMGAEYLAQKYYTDLLKFKMSDWNSEYFDKQSLTAVKDFTLHTKGIVTNDRTEDWAFGDTRFMEKILRNAIKINGYWISTYFLSRKFE